jgi:flagellar assembly protein FliH
MSMFPNDTPSPTAPAPWADPRALNNAPAPAWIVSSRSPEDLATPSSSDEAPEPPESMPDVVTDDGHEPMIPPPVEPVRDYESEIATLQSQLASTINDITSIRHTLLEASERELVRLSLVIAEKVIGRELTVDPALVADWARQGLKALADQDNLQIVVSPDIAEAIPDDAWRSPDGEAMTPQVDPQLAAGSCAVTGELSRVDASLAGRLGAVSDALGPGEEEEEEE